MILEKSSAFRQSGGTAGRGHILVRDYPAMPQTLVTSNFFLAFKSVKNPLALIPLCIHIIGTERRAQVSPTCSIFEKWEPWTEPELNPSQGAPIAPYF
jgi:hypothetical protein